MNKYFLHPSSFIDSNTVIGEKTSIWHFCHISENAKIGKRVIIGQNVFIGRNVIIGNGCKIQNNVSIYDGVVLEENVFCGPSCVFTNVVFPRAKLEQKDNFKKTIVRKNATIGANATIICGNEIGENSMIGAGAVVTKNVAKNTIVVGNPARFLKKIEE